MLPFIERKKLSMEKTFGQWLRSTRGTMSPYAFATKVGVDVRTVRNAEDRDDILMTTATRIGHGLGLSFCEVMSFWQGASLEAAAQYGEEHWLGALTRQDVQRWLLRLVEGHQRNQELLIAALNLITQRSGLHATPVPELNLLFGQVDIEKMLSDFPWLRYDVLPPLGTPIIADLLSVYQHGGLLLPSEIGAYITMLRQQKGLPLAEVSEATGIHINKLGGIENGLVKHVKFSELQSLDGFLQRGGRNPRPLLVGDREPTRPGTGMGDTGLHAGVVPPREALHGLVVD